MPLVGSGNSFGGISGSNATARLLVVISGTSAPLTAALAQASGSLEAFQQNAGALGNTLIRSLTLPLAALGGAALAMASRFETSLARIAGLTPLADQLAGGIGEVRDRIMEIASDPQVIAGPTDIADALYFAGSAGLTAAEAFDVVKLSAQGMSTGMGAAEDISKVLIFALNNYRSTGLTAAAAMDALTAAIREGTAAPDEMAVALGRLLPIAAKAGVTFEQVVGSVSALTNLGVPTRVATTSLRALFSQLLAPTIQATELLDQLGITAEELRKRFELGPIAAFQLLEKATAGNTDQMHDLIPQIRAITAYYSLSGTNADRYRQILDQVNNSQGYFAEALNEISKTPGFQFQKSLQSLQKAGIELGTKLFPVFRSIATIITTIADAFSRLPGPVQSATAAFLVLGAALGPALKLYGAMVQTITTTTASGLTLVSPSFKAIATNIAVAGVAAGIATASFQSLMHGSTSLATAAVALISAFVALRAGIYGIQQALSAVATERMLAGGVGTFLGMSTSTIGLIAAAIAAVGVGIAYVIGQSHKVADAAKDMNESFSSAASSGQTFRQVFEALKDKDAAANLTNVATQLGVIDDQLTSISAGGFRQDIGADLASGFAELENLNLPDVDRLLPGLEKIPDLIAAGAANGEDLNDALKGSGVTVDTILGGLGDLAHGPGASDAVKGQIDQLVQLLLAYNAAGDAQQQLIQSTGGTIAAHVDETTAIAELADKYGVSTAYMESKLSEFGVTATGVLGGNETEFGKAAGVIEGFSGDVVGASAEAKDAIASMASDMSESLQGTLGLFDEFPEKLKTSAEEMAKHAQAMAELAVQQTNSIRDLARRGVPSGLIDELISQGPEVLNQFANSSDAQLRKLVTAYSVRMAAMDAEILKESQHQEVKGKNMVAGFASAILGAKGLTTQAGNQIIQSVSQAFGKGDLKDEGLKQITGFVHALGRAKGLTKAQGAAAVNAFVQGILTGRGVNQSGQIVASKMAEGISRSAHIPIARARKLVDDTVTEVKNKGPAMNSAGNKLGIQAADGFNKAQGPAFTAGLAVSNRFADGIRSGIGPAVSAVQSAVAQVNAAWDAALKNSPEYFTYYMGKKLISDLNRGMKDGEKLTPGRPSVSMPKAPKGREKDSLARAIAAGIREGQGPLIVQIDGREVARATRRHHERQRA